MNDTENRKHDTGNGKPAIVDFLTQLLISGFPSSVSGFSFSFASKRKNDSFQMKDVSRLASGLTKTADNEHQLFLNSGL